MDFEFWTLYLKYRADRCPRCKKYLKYEKGAYKGFPHIHSDLNNVLGTQRKCRNAKWPAVDCIFEDKLNHVVELKLKFLTI